MLPISVHRFIYRLAPAAVRSRLKDLKPLGVNHFPLPLPQGQYLVLDHLEYSKILRRFAWKGIYGYEPHTIRLFHGLARTARSVLDIGAYFGLYALVAAKANPDAVVHAFEPLPQNVELLRHFLALNHCTHVIVHPVAIARAVGEATLYIPVERRSALPATGSLKDCFRPGERLAGERMQRVQVQTVSLDAAIEDAGIDHLDLVKIDTEETEHDVIASGIRAIECHRPDIIMEIIFDNVAAADALAPLRALGYRFFSIGGDGLVPFAGVRLGREEARVTSELVNCEILCTCRTDAQLPAY